ncbi:MAG: LacI family DNA-binding transcriptional regulator [Opitutales bacterium]
MAVSNQKPGGGRIDTTRALADHLGLSRWTISRVLNGHPGVKASTRQRVEAAMAELGFAPNPMARGLRGGRTRMIGVVFQELETPVLVKKVMALQTRLRAAGYQAVIELTGGRSDEEERVIQSFFNLQVDGVVLVGSTLTADHALVRELAAARPAVLLVDPAHTGLPFPEVTLDRRAAMPLLMRHLHNLGHRRFALLGINAESPYGRERIEGLRRATRSLGLSGKTAFGAYAEPGPPVQDYGYGWRLAEQALLAREPASAWLCLNDRVALGAIKRLEAAGLQVPADRSVTGFDNLDVGAFSRPTLTTIDQQVDTQMARTVTLLMSGFEQGAAPAEPAGPLRIEPRLKPRASTGTAPREPVAAGTLDLPPTRV